MGSVVILLILNVAISALIYIKMLHVNCDEMTPYHRKSYNLLGDGQLSLDFGD